MMLITVTDENGDMHLSLSVERLSADQLDAIARVASVSPESFEYGFATDETALHRAIFGTSHALHSCAVDDGSTCSTCRNIG